MRCGGETPPCRVKLPSLMWRVGGNPTCHVRNSFSTRQGEILPSLSCQKPFSNVTKRGEPLLQISFSMWQGGGTLHVTLNCHFRRSREGETPAGLAGFSHQTSWSHPPLPPPLPPHDHRRDNMPRTQAPECNDVEVRRWGGGRGGEVPDISTTQRRGWGWAVVPILIKGSILN